MIKYVNSTKEDVAGYSAEFYSRVNGLGAALVTYGVGLNVMAPTACAYAENSPLVIISGSPGVKEYRERKGMWHHTINK